MIRADKSLARYAALLAGTVLLLCTLYIIPAHADRPEVVIEIRDHLFLPPEVEVPGNVKIRLLIYNRDPSPEEFESYELNREKVIMGNRKAVIFIGPLLPGEYPFFGEFHPETAQGKVIVE